MTYSEKKQRQISLSALLNGIPQTLYSYSLSPEVLSTYLDNSLLTEIPLFGAIRQEILSYAKSKGLKGASET